MNRLIIFVILCLSSLGYQFPGAAYSLVDAQEDYLRGKNESAIEKAQSLRENAESLYFLGIAYIKTGNYPKARYYLNRLTQRFAYSDFYEQGLAKLADTYFLEKQYPDAEKIYKKILREQRFKDVLSVAYLRLAQIASRQGNWDEKNNYLKLINEQYPNSPESGFAKMLEEWDYFTIQVGAFSEKNNALSLKKELEAKYQSYIVEDKEDQYPIYKVRVGKFKKRDQTENVAHQLLESGYPARIYP